jgi:hypothetical protein
MLKYSYIFPCIVAILYKCQIVVDYKGKDLLHVFKNKTIHMQNNYFDITSINEMHFLSTLFGHLNLIMNP